jgi:hypothetical protein
MSWHGFKKAVSRATTNVLQSTGSIEKTIDKDFQEQEKTFLALEKSILQLYDEAASYLDSGDSLLTQLGK